ncbi:MAG: TonB-dependent receptor [Acidobacteriota bacterium]|nr:TonB-dependent receptor [Acidobacteriota bacterium]
MLLAFADGAGAQELRGRLVGTVTDATGAVLRGVTVTASSAALIRQREVVTGTQGGYAFPALPTGDYTLIFSRSDFQTTVRDNLRVLLNTTLTVDATLEVGAVDETITVSAAAPLVDVRTTTTAVNFTKELLEDVPNARDIWAAMAQAPGFQMEAYDVGGSHTGTQTGYQAFGFGDQHRTLLEGINVTEGTSANAGYFDYGSLEDFQLGGAGNMGETHGLGAFLNLTTKSGGDRFAGDVYVDFLDDGSVADNVPDALREGGGTLGRYRAPPGGLRAGNPLTLQGDRNMGIGGPLRRGRTWFYAGYRLNHQEELTIGHPNPSTTQLENWTAKVTHQFNDGSQLVGFFNHRTKLQPERGLGGDRSLDTAWFQQSVNMPMKLEYRNPLTNRMFLNLQASHWINRWPLYPTQTRSSSVEGLPPGRLEVNTGDYTNAHSYYHFRDITKPQASGSITFFADDFGGEHTLKAGFEAYRERRSFLRMQPGDLFYRDVDGAPAEVDIYNTPNTGVNTVRVLSGYVQDSWLVTNRLTLNLGARFDRYVMGWPDQSISPTHSDIWAPRQVGARDVLTWANVAPRIGAAFDVTGKGRTVVKLFAGRFYWNPSTTIVEAENPVGQAAARFAFHDLNGNRLLDAGPSGGLADSPELGRRIATFGGAGTVTVDPELASAYGHEISAHFEQQLADNLSVRGSYVYKNARNLYGIVDMNRAFAYRIPFAYTDHGADDVEGTADDQVLQLFDRPPDIPENRRYVNPRRHGLPSPDGDYHTAEVALNRRFSDRWMLLTSFMHTRARAPLRTTSSTSVRTAARFDFIEGTTYEWQANQARFGRVTTTYWNYKLAGRYVFPRDIGFTASYRLQSGFQVGRRITVQLPNAGTERVMANPYDDRAPNVGIFDLRAEKQFALRDGVHLTLLLDAFNVLNDATVLNFRTISGPRYNEIVAMLNPRVFRAGLRLEF